MSLATEAAAAEGYVLADVKEYIFGRIISALPSVRKKLQCVNEEYWDTCPEAGPAKRGASPFSEAPPKLKILTRDGDSLQ